MKDERITEIYKDIRKTNETFPPFSFLTIFLCKGLIDYSDYKEGYKQALIDLEEGKVNYKLLPK